LHREIQSIDGHHVAVGLAQVFDRQGERGGGRHRMRIIEGDRKRSTGTAPRATHETSGSDPSYKPTTT
jgi:hypothetical protein